MLQTHRRDVIIIFLLLAFVFGYFFQNPGWNENSRFDMIFASVQEKTFSIDNYYKQKETLTGDHAYTNGHYYSDKAIGPALLGILLYYPMYWIQNLTGIHDVNTVKEVLTFLLVGLPSAFEGSLIYWLCFYLSRKRLRSFLITLAITLGTMYFPYSGAFFSHQLTSALIFTAFFLIFFIRVGEIRPKRFLLFLIGLLMGWALISEFPCAAILLPLAIYYLIVLWKNPTQPRWRSILLPVLGGLIPIILQLVYNKICFGSLFALGYENLDNAYFSASMSKGLMGIGKPGLHKLFWMTFHPALGLFWQSPVLLLAGVGTIYGLLQQKYRREIILALWIIGSYLVLISGYSVWWGGYALSSRHIIPILPFFCLLLVFLPDPYSWALGGLGFISIGQMFLAAATNIEVPDDYIPKLATTKFFSYSNIYDFCLNEFRHQRFDTNLGNVLLGLKSWYSLLPFIIGVIMFILLFFWRKKADIKTIYQA